MEVGTVISTTVGPNRDGTSTVRLATCSVLDLTDVRTVQLLGPDDYNPSPGAKLLVIPIESSWEVGIPLEPMVAAVAGTLVGERVITSDVLAAKKAFIAWRNTGILEVNGTTDFAVAYTDLKIAFDQLKSDFDTFVTVKYNLHNHPTAPPGVVSVPSVTGTSSTADMSAAKVATVKLP